MNRLLLAALAFAFPLALSAADTAYTALRVVGKRQGDEALNRVVEVRGRFGSPDPSAWKVVLGERGGVREFDVQKGKITAERAPSGRSGGAPLDLNKLNIDSDGAFTIADQEAKKSNIPFDRIDYVLTASGRNGVPTWRLELIDGRNGQVGSVSIAADNGDIINRQLSGKSHGPVTDDRTYLRDHPGTDDHRYTDRRDRPDDRRAYDQDRPVYDGDYADDRRGPDDRRVYVEEEGPGITDIFGKIGRHFEKRGRQLKSFFNH